MLLVGPSLPASVPCYGRGENTRSRPPQEPETRQGAVGGAQRLAVSPGFTSAVVGDSVSVAGVAAVPPGDAPATTAESSGLMTSTKPTSSSATTYT